MSRRRTGQTTGKNSSNPKGRQIHCNKADWENYSPAQGEIVLNLDPGMALGTGTHETTILCIQALEKYINSKTCLLDIVMGQYSFIRLLLAKMLWLLIWIWMLYE